jgi:phage/plasmid-like protein (TIGR03299 family)
MSQHTIDYLNENTLIGFTGMRGNAWTWKAGTDNHFAGEVPMERVLQLFAWEPTVNLMVCPCGCGETWKAVSRSDNRHRMGIFKEGYEPHSFKTWLVEAVGTILDDTLRIGSAGQLRFGAVGWVSAETPDTLTTPEGVDFRPHLLATTSFDGSVATTYKPVVTRVVCDNTLEMAKRENSATYKIKHTRNSGFRVASARDALGIVHAVAEDFEAEVRELCATTVTEKQWAAFLDAYAPMPDDKGRGRTIAENKRDGLARMYRHDLRAAPWSGTAFGVLQAVDTWTQHEQTVRNVGRAERNMLSIVTGKHAKASDEVATTLRKVLASV